MMQSNDGGAILSAEDIRRLTGFQRWTAQVRALKRMKIKHRCRPDGFPIVTVAEFNAWRAKA
jgi:hypothetical protein